jgi:hypothetical protein
MALEIYRINVRSPANVPGWCAVVEETDVAETKFEEKGVDIHGKGAH